MKHKLKKFNKLVKNKTQITYKLKANKKKDPKVFLVRVVGLEPTRSCPLRILSPVRLPFRHTRATTLLYIKIVIKSIIGYKF